MQHDLARFTANNLAAAKSIILTPEDSTTAARWRKETPYLVALARQHLEIPCAPTLLIDYGCGVGRLSRELIRETACSVFGVDASPSMRALAAAYVEDARFAAVSPEMLAALRLGVASAAIMVWSLQHFVDPVLEIRRLRDSLCGTARVLLVNNQRRAVPVLGGWHDDGLDVRELMQQECFVEVAAGDLPEEHTTPALARNAFWAVYQKV